METIRLVPGDHGKCSICGKPSVPGLLHGHGKCQYHWNAGVWGKDWADKVEQDKQRTEMGGN